MKPKSNANHNAKQGRGPSLLAPVLCCTLLFGLTQTTPARATDGAGVVSEVVAVGDLPIDIRTKLKAEEGFGNGTDVARIAVVKFTVAPDGYFGWHRHGGPVWVTVTQGTLALYDPDEAGCPRTYHGAGSAFLDAGSHVHNARNEGTEPVVVYGTFMLPAGGLVRIDAPDPGGCPL
jgi:quercetin dioxygenase-like cupin family protein